MNRVGDWIQTYSSGKMYPLDPQEDEIHLRDIAHSLSNLCRFNGHVKQFYSVAEHCCHVCDILPEEFKRTGLLHDASEAYLCDLPRPLKRSDGLREFYMRAEENLMYTISWRFGLVWPMPIEVQEADNRLLGIEAVRLMSPLHPEWKDKFEPVKHLAIYCWTPRQAELEFLLRAKDLGLE